MLHMVVGLCVSFLVLAPQPPAQVLVVNPTALSRQQVMRVSVPLPRAHRRSVAVVKVEGVSHPCVPLVRYADGSLAVVQAHIPVELGPGQKLSLPVVLGPEAACRLPVARPTCFDTLPLHTEVVDPWGRVYTAKLRRRFLPELSTRLVQVHRMSGVHSHARLGDFLPVNGFLVTFPGSHRAELTLCLDNGRNSEVVLGPVRLRSFRMVTTDRQLRFLPRWRRQNLLRAPLTTRSGYQQTLLGPSPVLYLGDATAKSFRFDLYWDGPGPDGKPPGAEEKQTARAVGAGRLWPVPDLTWTRRTGAYGAHGGPAPLQQKESPQVQASLARASWSRSPSFFGPFGGFGDERRANRQGTPRNAPSLLHNALRWASPQVLEIGEAMALQQTLRPLPGWKVRLPENVAAFRAGMTPRTFRLPNGFEAMDYEHVSVDLLYEFYWLTGDPAVREELQKLGRELPRLWEQAPFMTSRGEGWCAKAAVLCGRATGDWRATRIYLARFVDKVLPALGPPGAGHVLAQPPHVRAFGAGISFDAPWQMAAFVYGMHALWQATADKRCLEALQHAAEVMAGPGWVAGKGPKYLLAAGDPTKFMMPVGFGPREGTALMQVSAFAIAARLAKNPGADRLLARANFLAQPLMKQQPQLASGNPWLQPWLDQGGDR